MKDKKTSQDWIAAGLAELARGGGVAAVRVEVLAERMGVTKGGFYRRFKDRRALMDAILRTWRDGRVAAIARQAEAGGKTPIGRLKSVTKLYAEGNNPQGLAIELAIRQWARTDPAAAAAAGKVDVARLKTASALYQHLGLAAPDADARALLLYTFLFGQSLLFLDGTPRRRSNLVSACVKTLMAIEGK